jgi:uncharacterized peroxidase-related enzyme
MTAFVQHTLDSAPDASKPVLASTASAYGFLPNLHATLAESPVALQALDSLFALIASSGLTPQEQQVAMLAVSVFNGCEYCVAGHSYVAQSVQVDGGAVQALRQGRPIAGDARLQALRSFTEAVLRGHGRAGADALAAFSAAGFTHRNALEVVTIVAAKVLSNYANNLARTPADPFMSDPALRWVAPSRSASSAVA